MRISLGRRPAANRQEALVRRDLQWDAPELPGLPPHAARRWAADLAWAPVGSLVLVRHRAVERPHWVHTNAISSPRGYSAEAYVAFVYADPMPSAHRLVAAGDDLVIGPVDGEVPVEHLVLGHVEQLPYVMTSPLQLWRTHATGQLVLSAHPADPIRAVADEVRRIGWVDTIPIAPGSPSLGIATWGLRPLLRSVDIPGSRHRYAARRPTDARADGEVSLGSLWERPGEAWTALVRDARGRIGSDLLRPGARGSAADAVRWALAPVRWAGPRWGARTAAARTVRLARRGGAPHDAPGVLGHLRREPAPGWSPLFSAHHPAVGDQLLTRSAIEALDLGYVLDGVLGYVCDAHADTRLPAQPDLPWASRFGRGRRFTPGPLPG